MAQSYAFLSDSINVRSGQRVISQNSDVAKTQVIGNQNDKIGSCILGVNVNNKQKPKYDDDLEK